MLFKQNVLAAIARRDVTVAFRRWRRPTVRAGSRLRTAAGVLEIVSVEEIELDDITQQAAREAGYESREAAWKHLAGTEGSVYRIRFRLVGDDPRIALRNERLEQSGYETVMAVLMRLDRNGKWTRNVLELIQRNPGIHAQALSDEQGMERLTFKRRVRQLKELGLTESLKIGYRLSPRGESVLEYLQQKKST